MKIEYEEVVLWPVKGHDGSWWKTCEAGNVTISVGWFMPWPKGLWEWFQREGS